MMLGVSFLLLSSVALSAASFNCKLEPRTNETGLKKSLFCSGYDSTLPPAVPSLPVQYHMVLNSFNLHPLESYANIYVWMFAAWSDPALRWDKKTYPISRLIVNSDEVWKPRITPDINMGSNQLPDTCASYRCEIQSYGMVSCMPPCSYQIPCTSDTTNWPFDVMNCTVQMGMWESKISAVVQISDKATLKLNGDVLHSEWSLLGMRADTRYDSWGSEPTNKVDAIVYQFYFQRHVMKENLLLVPGFALLIINLVTLCNSGNVRERLFALGCSVLGHLLYIEFMYWHIPYMGGAEPKLLIFFRDSLAITTITLVVSFLLINLQERTNTVKPWIISLATWLTASPLGRFVYSAKDGATHCSSLEANHILAVFINQLLFVSACVCYVLRIYCLVPSEAATTSAALLKLTSV